MLNLPQEGFSNRWRYASDFQDPAHRIDPRMQFQELALTGITVTHLQTRAVDLNDKMTCRSTAGYFETASISANFHA